MYVHEIMEKTGEIEYFNAPFGRSPTGRIVNKKEFNDLAKSSIINSVMKLEKRESELSRMKAAMEHFCVDPAKIHIINKKIARVKNAIDRIMAAINGEDRVSFYCQYRAIIGVPENFIDPITDFRSILRQSLGIENVSSPFIDKEWVFEVKINDPYIAFDLLNKGVIDDGLIKQDVSLFAMEAYMPRRSNLQLEEEIKLGLASTFKPASVLNKSVPFVCHRPLEKPFLAGAGNIIARYLQGEIYQALEVTLFEKEDLLEFSLCKPVSVDESPENCLALNQALIHLFHHKENFNLNSEAATILLNRVVDVSN